MQESTIPLITAITILGIITLLFFVNEFFRKYKVVKKRKPSKRKHIQCPVNTIVDNISYFSKIGLIVSDMKQSIEAIPENLPTKIKIEISESLLNQCKLKTSNLK